MIQIDVLLFSSLIIFAVAVGVFVSYFFARAALRGFRNRRTATIHTVPLNTPIVVMGLIDETLNNMVWAQFEGEQFCGFVMDLEGRVSLQKGIVFEVLGLSNGERQIHLCQREPELLLI